MFIFNQDSLASLGLLGWWHSFFIRSWNACIHEWSKRLKESSMAWKGSKVCGLNLGSKLYQEFNQHLQTSVHCWCHTPLRHRHNFICAVVVTFSTMAECSSILMFWWNRSGLRTTELDSQYYIHIVNPSDYFC